MIRGLTALVYYYSNSLSISAGREWDYVIMSTVRSMPKCQVERQPTSGWICRNLGALADQHQINVAITRARKGLVLIGKCIYEHVLFLGVFMFLIHS